MQNTNTQVYNNPKLEFFTQEIECCLGVFISDCYRHADNGIDNAA